MVKAGSGMRTLGGSAARVRPALSRTTATVGSPGKIQQANASGKLPSEPLAIRVKVPKKKKAAPSMARGIAGAMLRGM